MLTLTCALCHGGSARLFIQRFHRFVGAAMCGLYSGADRQNDIDISKIKIRLTYNSTEMLIFYMNHWLLFLMHPSLRVFLEFYVMLPFLRDIPTLI